MFVNTLTVDNKYSCRNMQNLPQQFQSHYLKKEKLFVDFLLYLWNVHQRENIFKKKISIVVSLLPKFLNPKEEVS